MANAVFTTKVNPDYNDLPEIQYHFQRTYLKKALEAIGDWILYYEPRREGPDLSGSAGRQCYFATAKVDRIEEDPAQTGYFYAYMSGYLEFANPVPFREQKTYYESALRKTDGSTNKGQFGRAVRLIPAEEYKLICSLGFAETRGSIVAATAISIEDAPIIGRTDRVQTVERPFRDAAFARVVQKAYDSTCAMTGLKLINGGGRCEIEAAHIMPVAAMGPDSPRNGLALSRTVHWMFDRGILSVSEQGEILAASNLVSEPVKRMLNPDGQVKTPGFEMFRPHPIFLKYHREHVFKG